METFDKNAVGQHPSPLVQLRHGLDDFGVYIFLILSFCSFKFDQNTLFFFAVRSDSEQTKSWWDVHLPSCWMCLPTVSYGPLRIISTYKTPFIECIIPVITSYN